MSLHPVTPLNSTFMDTQGLRTKQNKEFSTEFYKNCFKN